MLARKDTAPTRSFRDPFAFVKHMTSEFDRLFEEPMWPTLRLPLLGGGAPNAWLPNIDVFEKDNRLFTKVDLPGLKPENVTVEVTDGYLTIAGERKSEVEEKKENVYRSERQYGTFLRTVPLPEGVKPEDVKATFTDGVLEVSVSLPVKVESKAVKVAIEEAPKAIKAA